MSIPKQKTTLFSWAICIVLFFSVGIRGYSYTSFDTNHNRTSKTVTSTDAAGAQLSQETTSYILSQDGLNQLLAIHKPDGSKVEYTYDASGNRSTRTRVTSNNVRIPTHAYTWDIENRLTRITNLQNLDQDNYTYDHGNRRVTHQKGGQKFGYIYAGNSIVQKYNITNSTMANATHPDVEYIRGSDSGGGVGGLLYTQQENADPSYSHADARGDILGRYAQDGSQTYSATYKANGQTIETSGSNPDDIGQNTKQTDTENGLVYFGHRYYDPEAGVWLSRDPLGFADGLNLYAYNHNNAWTQFDPDGRYSVVTGAIFGAVIAVQLDFIAQVVENRGFEGLDYDWGRGAKAGIVGGISGGIGSLRNSIGYAIGSSIGTEIGIQTTKNLLNGKDWDYNIDRAALSGMVGGALGTAIAKPVGALFKAGIASTRMGAAKLSSINARGMFGRGTQVTKVVGGKLGSVPSKVKPSSNFKASWGSGTRTSTSGGGTNLQPKTRLEKLRAKYGDRSAGLNARINARGDGIQTWNQFRSANKGLYSSMSQAGKAWKVLRNSKGLGERLRNLRSDFNSIKPSFIRAYANSPEAMRRFSHSQRAFMGSGQLPKGYVIHHKNPLYRGGDNSFLNFRVMKDTFHKRYNKRLHYYGSGRNIYR